MSETQTEPSQKFVVRCYDKGGIFLGYKKNSSWGLTFNFRQACNYSYNQLEDSHKFFSDFLALKNKSDSSQLNESFSKIYFIVASQSEQIFPKNDDITMRLVHIDGNPFMLKRILWKERVIEKNGHWVGVSPRNINLKN